MSIGCARVVTTLAGDWIACCASRWRVVEMVGGLDVSPSVPPSRPFCPASPAL
jgi:hypothetical protein